MEAHSTGREPVYGHELISLVVEMGGTLSVDALREAAAGRFGAEAIFANCAGHLFSFEQALAFLASKGKLEIREGTVRAGHVPGCG